MRPSTLTLRLRLRLHQISLKPGDTNNYCAVDNKNISVLNDILPRAEEAVWPSG